MNVSRKYSNMLLTLLTSTDQRRGYGYGQNVAFQHASATGASNSSGYLASTSRQTATGNSGAGHFPSMTPQCTLNSVSPTFYAHGTPADWITSPPPSQIQLSQTNVLPHIGTTYNGMFDPSQQLPSQQQPAYVHLNRYPPQADVYQQSQQQGLDTIQQGNRYYR